MQFLLMFILQCELYYLWLSNGAGVTLMPTLKRLMPCLLLVLLQGRCEMFLLYCQQIQHLLCAKSDQTNDKVARGGGFKSIMTDTKGMCLTCHVLAVAVLEI